MAGANTLRENRIYAVNHKGQLLSYTDNGKHGNVGNPHLVVVGSGAWGQFGNGLFAGQNANGVPCIYAVSGTG